MTYQFDKSGMLVQPVIDEAMDADPAQGVIVFDKGVLDDGESYWVYVRVRPSKYEEFMRLAEAKQRIIHSEFGEILSMGFEAEVPQEIKDEMRDTYGCRDDFMQIVQRELEEAQKQFLKKQEDKRLGDIVAMMKKQSDKN